MITIENVNVYGWETAIRGMRNPMNSWDKSDSRYEVLNKSDVEFGYLPNIEFVIGENDLKLMHNLAKAGNDHGKFARMITVTMDITAPLYWWKEFDTYKIGTVANSCSTMHKIHSKEFTLDDFSTENLFEYKKVYDNKIHCIPPLELFETTITVLNIFRRMYIETKNKDFWWQMIQLLPSSYNQKRTVQMNYQVLANIYKSRKGHKLDEWQVFREWCETLPYFVEIYGE